MKAIISLLLLFVLVTSCGEQETSALGLDEIMPKSAYMHENVAAEVPTTDSISPIIARFNRNGIYIDTLTVIDVNLFPDRFSPVNVEKYDMVSSNNRLKYYNWSFDDSISVMNMFFNWLDVLGQEGVGVSSSIKKDYLYILVGDTNLIFIDGSDSIDALQWVSYHTSIGHNENWNYLIEQPAGGTTKWYQFANGEKQEFKLERQ